MHSNQRTARTAGVVYVILILASFFSIFYFPSHIVVRGDALATVNNIVANMSLFRLGILNDVINAIASMLLPLALYKLLRPVSKTGAVLMVLFALAYVPLLFSFVLDKINVLSLMSGASYLQVLPAGQLNAQVMLSLGAAHNVTFLRTYP